VNVVRETAMKYGRRRRRIGNSFRTIPSSYESAVIELHPKLCDANKCINLLKSAELANYEVLRETEDFMVVYFRR
jgi:hypothetical protein